MIRKTFIQTCFIFVLTWSVFALAFSKKAPTTPTPQTPVTPISSVKPRWELKDSSKGKVWSDLTRAQVTQYGLEKTNPSNITDICKEYPTFNESRRTETWVHLIAAMSEFESSHIPTKTYKESFKNSRGEYVISTGLLQLSYESAGGYGFRVTTNDLKDPTLNIKIAVKILQQWVKRDGVVYSKTSPWRGGGRYWSVLRATQNPNAFGGIKKFVQQYCSAQL